MSMTDEQLRKEFDRVDKDKSGSITIQELRNYYIPMQEMLGVAPEIVEQEIRGLIKRLDTDNSGTISFEGQWIQTILTTYENHFHIVLLFNF